MSNRFKPSALMGAVQYRSRVQLDMVAVGVAQSPYEWCGADHTGLGRSSADPMLPVLFEVLPQQYLARLQDGTLRLLIDQTHEGYQTVWLWEWFHNCCLQFNFSPRQLIYATGNLEAAQQYAAWCDATNVVDRMLVYPFPIFEMDMWFVKPPSPLPTVDRHLEYKATHSVKLLNALQKRPRNHRMWLFYELVAQNLLNDSIVSMNEFPQHRSYCEGRSLTTEQYATIAPLLPILPPDADNTKTEFAGVDCGTYLTNFNTQVMLDTWVSVISEASFADSELTCFLSEKTFKTIRAHHPFIIFGNRGSLRQLRAMGYKTFSPFIDESYDDYPTWERLDAIMQELHRLNQIVDKASWFEAMRDILDHNYAVMQRNSTDVLARFVQTVHTHISQD